VLVGVIVLDFNDPETKSKNPTSEAYYNDLFCESVGGRREVRHNYYYGDKKSYIKVDCETDEYVFEGGKDKRSSLDSIQQVLFFESVSGKTPAIVIYDTDGKYGRFEHRIKTTAEALGVKFILEKYNKVGK
jgi:hypothetical protein